ncbi:acidic fibroblast growth factor intracellular binding [Schistosoma japonicum]|uniref:Acidic fibroblast growth factor intracellular binding n=1 Tax=Schistosoma japonicum TaxID=6182 RepID=A0A4Z2DDR2_SCHJA|nr:acidic fibroblast growth factor intracellular binding [Schistosoma japonicum]
MRIGNVIMGDIACRTVDGNSCIPHKEFGTYTCQCITGYEKLINPSLLPRESILHNCLVRVNPCVMEPCIHGICVMILMTNIV